MTKYGDRLNVRAVRREWSEMTVSIVAGTTGWLGMPIMELGTLEITG